LDIMILIRHAAGHFTLHDRLDQFVTAFARRQREQPVQGLPGTQQQRLRDRVPAHLAYQRAQDIQTQAQAAHGFWHRDGEPTGICHLAPPRGVQTRAGVARTPAVQR
jgi:hypothetical protein